MTEELFDKVCQLVNWGVHCMCGKKLSIKEMEWYEHSNGINVPNYQNKQWVYVTCNSCHYQNSWIKILKRARLV